MKTFIRAIIWNFAKWLFFRHDTGKTNATFFRRGTLQRNAKDQRPTEWHWMPGYERLVVKLLVVGFLVWAVIWWFHGNEASRFSGALGVACLLGFGVWMFTLNKAAGWKHNREVVAPLQTAVDHIMKEAA